MYVKKGNYGHAIPLIERVKNLAPKDKQCLPLMKISYLGGLSMDWTSLFNNVDVKPSTLKDVQQKSWTFSSTSSGHQMKRSRGAG
ncbi:hypothetical protein PISMIDRAFT_347348 [Pisolithus microcarpus 441]|uniref:Unplaced genomic scaffold scaffold_247, whole genome shotgun sequence n=1 Tax=Pisolithus microcarpus 441 TaxID=765257 RepID=A0A0C9Z3I1_9AGAM|nr:hypothetical protein PISMIDRAFT_347348 [Pisolithus microcarpus 441]